MPIVSTVLGGTPLILYGLVVPDVHTVSTMLGGTPLMLSCGGP